VQVVLAAAQYSRITPSVRTELFTAVSPMGNYTYDWFKNGVQVPGATDSILPITGDMLGQYNVVVTDIHGCKTTSNKVTVSDSSSRDIFIYPNPSKGQFEVRYFNAGNSTINRAINIYDSKGALIFSKSYIVSGSYGKMFVDISNMASGVYFVALNDEKGKIIASGKVVVAK